MTKNRSVEGVQTYSCAMPERAVRGKDKPRKAFSHMFSDQQKLTPRPPKLVLNSAKKEKL
jgi:hypothetical protein